jgi:hypothetical protein
MINTTKKYNTNVLYSIVKKYNTILFMYNIYYTLRKKGNLTLFVVTKFLLKLSKEKAG